MSPEAHQCLVDHREMISQACRLRLGEGAAAPAPATIAVAPATPGGACRTDYMNFCAGLRPRMPAGRKCLARNFARFSLACRQEIRRLSSPAVQMASAAPAPSTVPEPAAATAAGVTKDELMEMLKEVAAESGGKQAKRTDIASDVDAPRFHLPERPDDYALVVGVERYVNDLPEATFAERDADAVRAELVALGWPERNIKVLKGERASLSALSAYVEDWLPRNLKDDSRLFVYFSGHGAPDPESHQAYLVPFDGDPKFLDKTAYPVKRLYAKLDALKASQIVVALDSCFSGSGGRSVLAEGARPLVTQVDSGADPAGKLLVYSAAANDEITSTLPDQGHGIFTYYFLKGLSGAAKDEGGAVTSKGLYEYLKPKVQDAASRQNREQTPGIAGPKDQALVRF